MKRVTWPDREQLRNATFVILVFVIILAIIMGLFYNAACSKTEDKMNTNEKGAQQS